ncbi:MAG: cell division protein FtsQ/DivIB [Candidatus Bipolaricaulia bacterium]
MRKRLIFLGVVSLLALLGWTFLGSGLFRVREIIVEGGERVSPERVKELIGIRVGENIFTAGVGRARRALLGLLWVREARVRRTFPSRILVQLEEREPVLLIALGDERYWVDRDGYLLERAGPEASGLFLSGVKALKTPQGWQRLDEKSLGVLQALLGLDEKFLAGFTEAHLNSSSPELVLQGRAGFRVLLDLEGLVERLRLLQRLLTALKGSDYSYIDLRFGDVVLRPR